MAIYLYANAVLYVVFALWITLSPWATATGVGYETLSRSGRSEYLVVYGGLQLGLAAFFAFAALSEQTQRLGVIFALCLYAPIVAYRVITVIRFWPVQSTTLWVGSLEAGLLLAAIGVYVYCAGRNP
jgi:hypothetical protein